MYTQMFIIAVFKIVNMQNQSPADKWIQSVICTHMICYVFIKDAMCMQNIGESQKIVVFHDPTQLKLENILFNKRK